MPLKRMGAAFLFGLLFFSAVSLTTINGAGHPENYPANAGVYEVFIFGGSYSPGDNYSQNLDTVCDFVYSSTPLNGSELLVTYGEGDNQVWALSQCSSAPGRESCEDCLIAARVHIDDFNASYPLRGGGYWTNGTQFSCFLLYNNQQLDITDPDVVITETVTKMSPVEAPTATSPNAPVVVITKSRGLKNWIAYFEAAIILVCLVALFVCCCRSRHYHSSVENLEGVKSYSYETLRASTRGFSEQNKLGQGGFGVVYKGTLECGAEIAVKQLIAISGQGLKEFENEVRVITSIQHKNLVRFKGYCLERRLLVYEYLQNRSLDLALFDPKVGCFLDWPARFNIVLGIARGLEYLHQGSPTQIIHRDIKASNILLDNQLGPKICDFGISRLFPTSKEFTTTKVMGTLGYVAPEVFRTGMLTAKADVYSYGVLVLEILAGRKCNDHTMPVEKQLLLPWAWQSYERGRMLDVVDTRLDSTYSINQLVCKTRSAGGNSVCSFHIMIFIVQFFIFLLELSCSHAQQNEVCPLDFNSVPYTPDRSCPVKHESGLELTQCCKVALAYLMQVLALHTNQTDGQPLFLDNKMEADCWDSTQKLDLGVDYNYCEFAPPRYTANRTGCNFATVQELERSMQSINLNLDDLVQTCKYAERSTPDANLCLSMFSSTSKNLSIATGDDLDNCATAVVISVISFDVKNTGWVQFLIALLSHDEGAVMVSESNKKERVFQISLILVCSCVGFGLIVGVVLYIRKRGIVNSEPKQSDSDKVGTSYNESKHVDGKPLLHREGLYAFSRKEIWKATRNFNTENFIGAGSAGMVHKGVLPSGQLVAVKHIDKEKKAETFFKEVESLSKVRHPNLVSLLGYCQSGEDYYLVYEYCSKGNLWQWLFGDKRVLTWEERLRIAMGSARGLLFLHTSPQGVIVHRDVKPTNILLNDNMDAKLSDFGLSRIIAMEESHVYTEVKGTSGYLDPEYMSRGQLTLASDIYSFGIVLLQLVSGRRPIDFDLTHRYTLLTAAKRVIEKGSAIQKFVDPRLKGKFCVTAARNVVEVAVFCTSQSSQNRPSIKEVNDTLETAWRMTKTDSQIVSPVSSSYAGQSESGSSTIQQSESGSSTIRVVGNSVSPR